MLRVLLISEQQESLLDLKNTLLLNPGIEIHFIQSGTEAFKILSQMKFDLVIADERLADMTNVEFAKKLVTVNPMMNCALTSPLSKDDFHEATEGLGILMQLPLCPGEKDAGKLLKYCEQIMKEVEETKNSY